MANGGRRQRLMARAKQIRQWANDEAAPELAKAGRKFNQLRSNCEPNLIRAN